MPKSNGMRAQPRAEIRISGYGAKLPDPDKEGAFLGDRVSGRAFVKLFLKHCRKCKIKVEKKLSEGDIDRLLEDGEPAEERATRDVAVEFGDRLSEVIKTFLKWRYWRNTERIVIGGGMAARHVGDIAIHAAQSRLMKDYPGLELERIHHHPDEAGLVGSAHLIPPSRLAGKDGLLAVDIGGSKVRAGIVEFGARKSGLLADARVWRVEVWRHAKARASQRKMIKVMAEMLSSLNEEAEKAKFRLSPLVRVGVPGEIDKDGYILSGAQNLPGNWEDERFNLPLELSAKLPKIGGEKPSVSIHNDAVVQGLAELPFMRDVKRWGILTIGSGLGNAHFVNR
ncbi:MAG TPA: ROK family protein [Alphaproteobacteria bacterium]|nr:ROK family protein [Alphaproteobacteria bacterium]